MYKLRHWASDHISVYSYDPSADVSFVLYRVEWIKYTGSIQVAVFNSDWRMR